MSSRIIKLISVPIISAYLLINAQAAGATCPEHSSFFCRLIAWGGWTWPNPDKWASPNPKPDRWTQPDPDKEFNPESRLAEIQDRMAKAPVTATIYLEKGYLNSQIGNYPQSRESFTQGLELTKSAKDLKGQALALEGLGIASIKMGDNNAARDHLTKAKSLYDQLGEKLLVNEMHLYLNKIPKPKVRNRP
jgi:tetratricopeptide (TPR) repeat protein